MGVVLRKSAPDAPQDPSRTAYDELMDEYRKLSTPTSTVPRYTPEQVQERVAQSNQLADIGIVGSLAADKQMQGLGGSIFKKALSDRAEQVTERGTYDPLTGETAESPEYKEKVQETRRGRVLDAAIKVEESRAKLQQQHEEKEADRQLRRDIRADINANSANRTGGKPPPGYRFTPDGDLEAIPGGPAASKEAAAQAKIDAAKDKLKTAKDKRRAAEDASLGKAEQISAKVDEAVKLVDKGTTGLIGSQVRKIPGTKAYNLSTTIDTIKANLGFEELNKMRQMSPTGGALGQVAVQELQYLQATIANLDPNQDDKTLKKNLDQVKKHYDNWKTTVKSARGEEDTKDDADFASPKPAASEKPRRKYNAESGELE